MSKYNPFGKNLPTIYSVGFESDAEVKFQIENHVAVMCNIKSSVAIFVGMKTTGAAQNYVLL